MVSYACDRDFHSKERNRQEEKVQPKTQEIKQHQILRVQSNLQLHVPLLGLWGKGWVPKSSNSAVPTSLPHCAHAATLKVCNLMPAALSMLALHTDNSRVSAAALTPQSHCALP